MKTPKWLVTSLIIVFLFGCTLPTGGPPASSQRGESPSVPLLSASDTPTPIPPASDTPTSVPLASDTPTPVTPESGALQGSNVPVSLDIPSQNDPAPAGILDQLSWAGMGSDPGAAGSGVKWTQVCGECDVAMGSDHIAFSNFRPSQELKALIYRHKGEVAGCAAGSAEYVTTLSIRVDETGNFSAGLSGPTKDLYVVSVFDTITGEKIWKSNTVLYDQLNCTHSCPGAPPQRLQTKQTAYVCTSKDSVKLRKEPGKIYSTIQMLGPGTVVTVIDGPICVDNWSWWKIRTASGSTGWMSEGGDNTDPYFLCPKP